jgi:RNA polymerase sigma-70 factor (ECF subfamily)
MVGAMAKIQRQIDNDDLIQRAKTDADALGELYELYYERIYKFCVHRLFDKQTAEDTTGDVFLDVAKQIRYFPGVTEDDFANWLYAVTVNHTNAYVRKQFRREQLLESAAGSLTKQNSDCSSEFTRLDWPALYSAILKLKPKHQTILTLRFFENLEFEQIAKILKTRPATIRVTLHRILKKLREYLDTNLAGG